MRTESKMRQMIEILRGTLRNQYEEGTIHALGALLWAVGDATDWAIAHAEARAIAERSRTDRERQP